MATQLTPDDRPRPLTVGASPAPSLPGGVRGWLRRCLGIDALLLRYGRAILRQQQLVEGQRRDFDHVGLVLGLRDQLDDDRNKSHTETAERVQRLELALQGAVDALYSVQDRLAWHETRIPVLHKSKKAYDAAIVKEKARREQLVKDHPELSDAGKSIVMRTGKLPEAAAAAAPEPMAAPPTSSPPSSPPAPDTSDLSGDVVRRLELIREQELRGGVRTPSPSEREAAAEAQQRVEDSPNVPPVG